VTLGDLRTYVLDRLSVSSADTAKVAQIDHALNQEYRRLVAEEDLNVTTAAITLTAGVSTASLPADTAKILYLQHAGNVLRPVTWPQMAAYYAQTALGVSADVTGPAYYTVKGPTSLYLWPQPDATAAATTVTIWYVARPTLMTDPAAHSPDALPAEWHDLLAEMAVSRVAMNEEAFDLADRASQAAQAMRERMRGAVSRAGGSTSSRMALRFYGTG
jgi:hypothetical protein